MSDLELSRTIREQGEGQLSSRQGKVVSVQNGPPRTLTVSIGGQNIAGVRVMDHVDPVANEGVWLLDMGNGRWLCYGTNSGVTGPNPVFTGVLQVGRVAGIPNRIEMPNSTGVAAPTANPSAQSDGMKLQLYPNRSSSGLGDYGIGISAGQLWFQIPGASTSYIYKWFGGTTELLSLRGDGLLSVGSLAITSNALVTNLNADRLDSKEGNTYLYTNHAANIMQRGSFSSGALSNTAGSFATGTLTFPTAFSAAPTVIVSCSSLTGNTQTTVMVTAVTASDFNWRVQIAGTSASSVTIWYIAIGAQ